MDRREFIKKSAMATAAGVVMASPLGTIMAKDSNNQATNHSHNMKVLLINGSPRPNGNTNLALTEAARQLEKNGITTELLQIGRQAMHGCVACGHCSQTNRCVFDDDLCNRAIDLMAQSDALIVGSPTYYGQPNGTVLSLIQRMSYAASNVMQNMPIVTSQYWNIVYGRTEGEAKLDAEGLQTMRTMADNMAFLLQRIHADGTPQYPKREPHQATSFIK